MSTQIEITQKNHRRAVRFFWGLLIGATMISLIGNVVHAMLPYIPHVVIQIGAAAVPPIALLAAVHGIALAVRAGASGRVYRWAVSAVAAIAVKAAAAIAAKTGPVKAATTEAAGVKAATTEAAGVKAATAEAASAGLAAYHRADQGGQAETNDKSSHVVTSLDSSGGIACEPAA